METDKEKGLWDKTKAWADNNRVIAGAMTGFAAGTIVPGVGNIAGALGGALVGYVSHKEQTEKQPSDKK